MSQLHDRAGLGRRFLAITVDWGLAFLTSALFLSLQDNQLDAALIRLGIFVLEVSLITALTGSSMGQRLFGLRVVTWPNQGYLSPVRVLARTILIALVIPAVVYDAQGRGLHDRLAASVVVKVGSGF